MAEFFPPEWYHPSYAPMVIKVLRHWVDEGMLTQTRAKAILFEWAREAGYQVTREDVMAATGIGEGV